MKKTYRKEVEEHAHKEAKKHADFMGLDGDIKKACMAGASLGQCVTCQLLGISDRYFDKDGKQTN